MEITASDRAALQKLEEDLWREETRFDPQWMDAVTAEDYFEFGRSGRLYSRSDLLGFPRVAIDCVLPLPDFQARLLALDVAQVTYRSEVTYEGNTQYARRSSIWTRRGESWVLRFHQGTPIPEEK